MEKKEYLSQEKYDQLVAELNQLKTVTRREVAEQLDYAKSLGDLSENAEYHEARERQADTEDRIKELEIILRTCVIVKGKQGSTVSIGSHVVIQKDGGNREEFMIVGSEEADIASKKITHESPLGSALIGKNAGDRVVTKTPRGEAKYKILEVK